MPQFKQIVIEHCTRDGAGQAADHLVAEKSMFSENEKYSYSLVHFLAKLPVQRIATDPAGSIRKFIRCRVTIAGTEQELNDLPGEINIAPGSQSTTVEIGPMAGVMGFIEPVNTNVTIAFMDGQNILATRTIPVRFQNAAVDPQLSRYVQSVIDG